MDTTVSGIQFSATPSFGGIFLTMHLAPRGLIGVLFSTLRSLALIDCKERKTKKVKQQGSGAFSFNGNEMVFMFNVARLTLYTSATGTRDGKYRRLSDCTMLLSWTPCLILEERSAWLEDGMIWYAINAIRRVKIVNVTQVV